MLIPTHFASMGHNLFPNTNPHRKLCQSGVKKVTKMPLSSPIIPYHIKKTRGGHRLIF